MTPKKSNKLDFQDLPCRVCGDKAIGVNFNSPTCVSCKIFFRRNALREDKIYKCEFTNSCTITSLTRRFCAKCRLAKCFTVGMKKEFINSGKGNKTTNCKTLKSSSPKPEPESDSSSSSSSSATLIDEPKFHFLNSVDSSVESTTLIDEPEFHFLNSVDSGTESFNLDNVSDEYLLSELDALSSLIDSPAPDFDMTSLEHSYSIQAISRPANYFIHLLTTPQEELSQSDPLLESLAQLQSHQITPMFTEIGFPIQELAFPEKCMIQELSGACSVLQNHYRQLHQYQVDDSGSDAISISLISEHFLSRLMQMCSRLSSFRELGQGDQRLMLKRTLLEMTAIRSVLMFDPDRKAWFTMDDKNKVTAIIPVKLFRPFCTSHSYQRHRALPGLFRDEWKRDTTIFDLLTVIILFKPNSTYTDSFKIGQHHTRYSRLLYRYLSMKYPSLSEAQECFQKLLGNIKEMRTLNIDVQNFYQEYREVFKGTSSVFDEILDFDNSCCHLVERKSISCCSTK